MAITTSSRSDTVWRTNILAFALPALAVIWIGVGACGQGSVGQDPCVGRVCGEVEGRDCGACPGATDYCDDLGQCVDGCLDRACGPGMEGIDCGACPGATDRCDDQGSCVDLCEGRDCGEPESGISCGTCTPPRQCGLAGNCYAPGGCPTGSVEVTGQGYCIDPYEVTNSRYLAFLQDHGNDCYVEDYVNEMLGTNFFQCHPETQPGHLLWLSGDQWVLEDGYEEFPVRYVTLGGARVACEHWGGHLCKLGEWERACQGPQGLKFPYGDDYDPLACNACEVPTLDNCGDSYTGDATVVGSYSGCEGGYPGLFDMSGNVFEWVDHCLLQDAGNLHCILKGGDDSGPVHHLDCAWDGPDDYWWDSPYDVGNNTGFRCCYFPD